MSVPLPSDRELQFPDFTIISASAGSGKTYTLAHRLIQFLLSPLVPHNRLRNILAITFTNNAAREMRRRVLDTLKAAARGDEATLRDLCAVVDTAPEEIRERAHALVDAILDDYSFFQIQTIDSFLTRVFRASAIEFGLPPTIEVVLDSRDLLDEAVERFARELASRPDLGSALEALTDLIEESSGSTGKFVWNPFVSITAEVRDLYETLSAHPNEIVLRSTDLDDRRQCEDDILGVFGKLRSSAGEAHLDLTRNFVLAFPDADERNIEGLLLREGVFGSPFKKTGADAKTRRVIEEWSGRCAPLQETLKELRPRYLRLAARTRYNPYLRAYQLLRRAIDDASRRAGRIYLPELTRTLVRSMDRSVVPQVYLYLGDTIYHYLLDEFQDTAPVQWAALLPLVDEALAKEGSLFVVGDTKQSIYAFRRADWRIMRRLQEGEVFASARPQNRQLGTNFRSGEHLVNYTREFFRTKVPPIAGAEAAGASGLSGYAQDVPLARRGRGYVETHVLDRNEAHPPERAKIVEIIRDCRARGFRYADLTILTTKNTQVVEISGWLNAERIPFISHSSLDIRRRAVTGDLLAMLRFLDSPVDDLAFATVLLSPTFRRVLEGEPWGLTPEAIRTFLLGDARERGVRSPLYVRFRNAVPDVWNVAFDGLMAVSGYLPMYDLVCEIYRTFHLFDRWPDEEAALTRFLEAIVASEKRGANDLKQFLASAEDDPGGEWSIEAPVGIDAVSIMTVHKAKGLGSPVVIVLLEDSRRRSHPWYLVDTDEGAELLYIRKEWGEKDPALKEIVEREALNEKVDELNRLYVSLTRAREEMYILAVRREKVKGESSYFEPGGDIVGSKSTRADEDDAPIPEASLRHLDHRVRIRESAPGAFGTEERRRGEFLHEILARIAVLEEDPRGQVERVARDIAAEAPEKLDLEATMTRLLAFLGSDAVRPLVSGKEGRIVLTEQDVVDAEGRLFRMDRILVDPHEVTVLDYKTGGDSDAYDAQVRNYMELLRQLYPGRAVRGILAFIDRNRVREVV